jgi:hypothetical protein
LKPVSSGERGCSGADRGHLRVPMEKWWVSFDPTANRDGAGVPKTILGHFVDSPDVLRKPANSARWVPGNGKVSLKCRFPLNQQQAKGTALVSLAQCFGQTCIACHSFVG